jgi:hypothetical protein
MAAASLIMAAGLTGCDRPADAVTVGRYVVTQVQYGQFSDEIDALTTNGGFNPIDAADLLDLVVSDGISREAVARTGNEELAKALEEPVDREALIEELVAEGGNAEALKAAFEYASDATLRVRFLLTTRIAVTALQDGTIAEETVNEVLGEIQLNPRYGWAGLDPVEGFAYRSIDYPWRVSPPAEGEDLTGQDPGIVIPDSGQ